MFLGILFLVPILFKHFIFLRLAKTGKKLTSRRGGILLLQKYKFQIHFESGNEEPCLFLIIQAMNFVGSQGSDVFGFPKSLNEDIVIRKHLSFLNSNVNSHQIEDNQDEKEDEDETRMDLLINEMEKDESTCWDVIFNIEFLNFLKFQIGFYI